MKFLERYAFEYLPDITKLHDFPEDITDETIADYFNFNEMERNEIADITKRKYLTIN